MRLLGLCLRRCAQQAARIAELEMQLAEVYVETPPQALCGGIVS